MTMPGPTALKATSSVLKGVAGLRAGQQAKAADYAQASEEEQAGNAQALMLRDRARQVIGEQVAAQFANGFQGGTGSALDALAESQVNAALDVMELRRRADAQARAYRYKGDLAQQEGNFSLVSGLVGGASDVFGGMQDWASARAGQTVKPSVPLDTSAITVTRGAGLG